MTGKGFGMTCVAEDGRLVGVVTDGDLRRHMSDPVSLLDRTAADIMTPRPVVIDRDMLAVEALNIMEERKITSLVVVDPERRIEGLLHLHDLWRTQLF